jgi:glyoxylase-like metal-dependent hydrolase (beta-lactamase superfamily II)
MRERLSLLVRRLVAPNPSSYTGPGTNTYLVGTGDVTVIDPGPEAPSHTAAIVAALAGERLVRILVTHRHRDHAPGAAPLAGQAGAPVLAYPSLHDGRVLQGGGATLQALHTPGHASDHLAFLLREERALFAGDLIMSGSSVLISPPDGDMAAYLGSLERLRSLELVRIYPGHGEVIETPAAVVEEYIRHRLQREAQILEVLRAGPARIADLVSRIYVDVPAVLHPLAARSVHAHLLKLRAEGRAAGTDQDAEWRLG